MGFINSQNPKKLIPNEFLEVFHLSNGFHLEFPYLKHVVQQLQLEKLCLRDHILLENMCIL